MTLIHVLLSFAVFCAAVALSYQIGEMRGAAAGRTTGYRACLGAIDSDEDARKVWRASK
jgi:hypothetical protein